MITSSWGRSGLRPRSFLLLLALIAAIPLSGQPAGRRWLVDAGGAPTGNGAAAAPFNTIAAAVAAAQAGDTIVVRANAKPYKGGFALKGGQTLAGEGGTVVIAADTDVVRISGTTGDVTLANVTLHAGARAAGVVIENAKGTVTLRDVLVSTAGGAGVTVKSAAKVVVSGTTAVAAIDAPAVTIDEAALDAVFSSVSARGATANGIVLRKTTGRFTVAGTAGQRGSGGTIDGAGERAISATNATNVAFGWMTITRGAKTNGAAAADCGGNLADGSNEKCNAAVYLASVDGASLEGVVIDGSAQAGIVAHGVRNLRIASSEVRGAGDELFEHGVVLQNLRGDCRITGTKIERSASRHLMLHNDGGALTMLIDGSSFADNPAPNGQQAVLISAAKSASINVTVRGSSFARSFSHALDVTAADESKITLAVSGDTFDGNASAINVSSTGRAAVQYTIADNAAISGSSNSAINIFQGSPSLGTMSGTIARNTIGRSGVARSGAACSSCNGIVLSGGGNGMFTAEVTGNVVQQVGGSGLAATAGPGGGQMRLTVTSNLFRQPAGGGAPAIRVSAGVTAADSSELCADIGGAAVRANTIEGSWQPDGDIHLIHRFANTRFRVAGLSGANSDAAAAAAVGARNHGVKVRAALRPDSQPHGFEPAERCTIQSLNR